MKQKVIFLIILIYLFIFPCYIFAHGGMFGKQVEWIVRPYGSIGKTFIDTKGNSTNYKGGVQALWTAGAQLIYLGIGLDIGYSHFYDDNTTLAKSHQTNINSLVIGEFNLFFLDFMIGLGPYFDTKYSSNIDLGFMLSGGITIPIHEDISIPLLARTDLIAADNLYASLTFFSGITFFFR